MFCFNMLGAPDCQGRGTTQTPARASRICSALTMDTTADAPLRIGNLRSAKWDKPIVAIGIEGSANKVQQQYPLWTATSFHR